MGKELLRIWEVTRKTVLFITHSLTEAVYLSDVIFVMSASPGRIVETIEVRARVPSTSSTRWNSAVSAIACGI